MLGSSFCFKQQLSGGARFFNHVLCRAHNLLMSGVDFVDQLRHRTFLVGLVDRLS
jgi:hypothetical protein